MPRQGRLLLKVAQHPPIVPGFRVAGLAVGVFGNVNDSNNIVTFPQVIRGRLTVGGAHSHTLPVGYGAGGVAHTLMQGADDGLGVVPAARILIPLLPVQVKLRINTG